MNPMQADMLRKLADQILIEENFNMDHWGAAFGSSYAKKCETPHCIAGTASIMFQEEAEQAQQEAYKSYPQYVHNYFVLDEAGFAKLFGITLGEATKICSPFKFSREEHRQMLLNLVASYGY